MDVWFDSGSSWAMLPEMGVGRGAARAHHADLCLEGSDQHRGWFQSQLLTAIGARAPAEPPVSPYASLFTHGMVLDEKGKKMSKSLGNIVSPMVIVHGSEVCALAYPPLLRTSLTSLYARTRNSPHTDLISCGSGRLALTSGRTCLSAPSSLRSQQSPCVNLGIPRDSVSGTWARGRRWELCRGYIGVRWDWYDMFLSPSQ